MAKRTDDFSVNCPAAIRPAQQFRRGRKRAIALHNSRARGWVRGWPRISSGLVGRSSSFPTRRGLLNSPAPRRARRRTALDRRHGRRAERRGAFRRRWGADHRLSRDDGWAWMSLCCAKRWPEI